MGNKLKVATNADTEQDQTPRAEPLQIPGHRGGEFIFYPKNDEEKDWQKAKENHTEKAYIEYRRKYPSGKYRANALKQIQSFPVEEDWRNAVAKNSVLAFELFIENYPKSPYCIEANKRIDDLLVGKTVTQTPNLEPKKGETPKPKPQKKTDGQKPRLPFEMIFVKGGNYTVEETSKSYTLKDFEIGKFPVTQKLWTDIMGENPSHFKGCDDCPVEQVSWDDCQEFLKKLNKRYPGHDFRLPTEVEWEFAAKGGKKSQGFRYAGSNDLEKVGWNRMNSNFKTHPVGQKKPNELGIHDMSGNVWEWCEDWYNEKKTSKVIRGGSWGYDTSDFDFTRRFDSGSILMT